VIIRQLKTQKFPTVLTGATTSISSNHYVFQFNDSGTIGWAN
jgi:hypothetical protein